VQENSSAKSGSAFFKLRSPSPEAGGRTRRTGTGCRLPKGAQTRLTTKRGALSNIPHANRNQFAAVASVVKTIT